MADTKTKQSKTEYGLHGKAVERTQLAEEGYEPMDVYADQGETRVVRDLLFGYTIGEPDADGNEILHARDVVRGDTVTIEQIGLLGLMKGERNHSFYTTRELELLDNPATGTFRTTEAVAATPTGDISELGEYELADWLKGPDDGKAPTVNEVLESVGDDKELAHRMLQAENIRSDGDPRKSLEAGLSRIIQEG